MHSIEECDLHSKSASRTSASIVPLDKNEKFMLLRSGFCTEVESPEHFTKNRAPALGAY